MERRSRNTLITIIILCSFGGGGVSFCFCCLLGVSLGVFFCFLLEKEIQETD